MSMNTEKLLAKLRKAGVKIHLQSDKLAVKLPKIFDKHLKTELIANKESIKEYLSSMVTSHSRPPKIKALSLNEGELSFAQKRLWFIDQMQGQSSEYNIPMAYVVEGDLALESVRHSLTCIANRHEVIRSVYKDTQQGPVFSLNSSSTIGINCIDLTSLDTDVQSKRITEIIREECQKPFDLTRDLMLRASFILLKNGDKQNKKKGVLLINMHHIASDGWSMEVLIKEFFELYRADIEGRASQLPELSIQYSDFAQWQRNWLDGNALEKQLDYWVQQLNDLPPVHNLVLDRPRPAHKQFNGSLLKGNLSAECASKIEQLAAKLQMTPFMIFHGALALMLSRHSYSKDIVIGTPVANRMHPQLVPLIGFFVNTLVLRVDTEHTDFESYFSHIKRVNLDAQINQDVPFEQLVERLQVARSNAHTPLFQIMLTTNSDFGVLNKTNQADYLDEVNFRSLKSDSVAAKFDLNVAINLSDQGGSLLWTYDQALFDENRIATFNAHLVNILEDITQWQPGDMKTLRQVKMLDETEKQRLLYELTGRQCDYPKHILLHELIEQQAANKGNKVALSYGGSELSFEELNRKANQMAHYLRNSFEIKANTLVGICAERSIETIVAVVAILKAGGAYVSLDPGYPKERIDYIIEDARVKVVLTQRKLVEAMDYSRAAFVCIDETAFDEQPDHDIAPGASSLNSDNLAYLIYTSGSTGRPKGVAISHKNASSMVHWAQSAFSASTLERVMASTSLNFDLSVFEIFVPLCLGHHCVLVDDAITAADNFPHVTMINTVPSAIKALLDLSVIPDSVLAINLAGEPLPKHVVNDLFDKTKCEEVNNLYGPSEDTTYSTHMRFTHKLCSEPPIGRSLPNTQALILTSKMELVPLGAIGQLYLAGDGVAKGYYGKEEMTAQRFIDNPFYEPGMPKSFSRMYQTGDLVRYDENGQLLFLGRIDDQVKVRGFRIELGEIEAHITATGLVESGLVVAKKRDQGDQHIVAYLCLHDNKDNTAVDEIKRCLEKALPSYMVPNKFMVIEKWPLTPNGKVDKNSLPVPEEDAFQKEYVAPKGNIELTLVSIWASLLNQEINKICVEDDFFDIGGHSLLMVRLKTEIGVAYGIDFKVKDLFELKSIREMSIVIGRELVKNQINEASIDEVEEVEF